MGILQVYNSDKTEQNQIGDSVYQLIEELFPICRSITGDGVRETFSIIQKHIPLKVQEVPTGTQVFDWVIPQEWNIRDAYIKDKKGNKVVDFKKSNLHVLNYSQPINKTIALSELIKHIYTLPENPDWVPYRTSYYNPNWGFCMSHNQLTSMQDEVYDVFIDAEHTNGSLTYAEYYIPGTNKEEILVFTHCCHPSLCNDNLTGISLATFLAKSLSEKNLHYSYRFVFAPATIGSITWMSQNEESLGNIRHGLVIAVAGDNGCMTYKKTRNENSEIDRAVLHVLKNKGEKFDVMDFSPWGYDERQFNSPGINLPVGRLTRTPNGCYPEYHTSADNLDLIHQSALVDTYTTYMKVFYVLENNKTYINNSPKGEPQLGKRGLYRNTGGHRDIENRQLALLWVLNLSDGDNSLLDIAERSGLTFDILVNAALDLTDCGLLIDKNASA